MKKHVLLLIVSLVMLAGKLVAQPPAPTGSASRQITHGQFLQEDPS
ncbi:MAG: hypothetical protein IPN68_09215 [Bacteroidetes bacterium]|nr:hypothetical protein [Bacteroidota bacterium]